MNRFMQRVVRTAVVLGLIAQGCSGADHDALAARDASAGGGGAGGGVIEAGSADAAPDAADAADDVADDAVFDDGPLADGSFGPDGPSVFTFFHGIPDARALRVCFEAETSNGFVPLDMAPLPDVVTGLPFGEALSASTLPGVDLETQSVRPVIYVGELGLIESAACDQMDPLPQGVERATLQALPAGTLSRGRSVLMVAAGCIGGPGHDDGLESAACGADFVPPNGNATLLVASMDRTPIPGALGLQVFAASLGAGKLTVDHRTEFPSMTATIAKDITVGAIAPRPPMDDLSVADLGTSAEENTLRVFADSASEPAAFVPLIDALARGGLSLDTVEDGKNYTLVLIGPKPGTIAGSWFKPFSITVIPNDP